MRIGADRRGGEAPRRGRARARGARRSVRRRSYLQAAMSEPALYRDVDGEMKPFAGLSEDGYQHNRRTGAFTQGNCRDEGHLYARELASAHPPTRACLRCGARRVVAESASQRS
jgi:hypothetical protein